MTTKLRANQIISDGWIPVVGSWAYASADAPTFTITVPSGAASIYGVGDRIKLTQTTVKYFIVTAVADTVLTVYGGTDYTLVDAAISAISFSHSKSPLGFPLSPIKWSVEASDVSSRSQGSPTQNAWYNLGSVALSIPIGCWLVYYQTNIMVNGGSNPQIRSTLSTANNSESDADFSGGSHEVGTGQDGFAITRQKFLVLAAKASYYLNVMTPTGSVTTIYERGDIGKTIIRATCAYL